MKKNFWYSFLILGLTALLVTNLVVYFTGSGSEKQMLEDALVFAGENRGELEKVLEHYRNDPEKKKAAEYLIRNMPGLFSYTGADLDSLHVALAQYVDSFAYDRKRFGYLKNFPYDRLGKVYDSRVITARYLIENIDYSFRAWRERPWSRYYSFDDFCEYILPYRVKDEPLSRWKKEYYERYAPVLDSLYRGTDVVAACDQMDRHVRSRYWYYFNDFNAPHIAADALDKMRIGNCEFYSDCMLYVMRAVGIPVATDMYVCSPDLLYSHAWSMVKDTTGKCVPFMQNVLSPRRGNVLKKRKGKVYRYGFAIRADRLKKLQEGDWPATLSDYRSKDVTADYHPSGEVRVECPFVSGAAKKETDVFLAVFSREGWKPIGEAESFKKGKAVFRHMEPHLIYGTLYYRNGRLTEAGYPFEVDSATRSVHYYRPQPEMQELKLTRKYPLTAAIATYMQRMDSGRFEGANRPDFRDADVLYRLTSWPKEVHNEAVLPPAGKKYRYVRYISADKYPGDIAEMTYFEPGGTRPLTGRVFGVPAYLNQPVCALKNAVDGDPLTYYSGAEWPSWVGLDLGAPREIGKIVYTPRNDDNFIRIGDEYELFYFSENGWRSLGRQQADSTVLLYRAPANALFWLCDRTRGKEEQVFTYSDGKQHFIHKR